MEHIISNNSVELTNKVNEVINWIENDFLKEKTCLGENNFCEMIKYKLGGDLNKFKGGLLPAIIELGICDRRRLKRYLNKVIHKKSLRSVNTLLRFLSRMTGSLTDKTTVKITEPHHENIQNLRKEWKELQSKADAAFTEYKLMKGNYYKK